MSNFTVSLGLLDPLYTGFGWILKVMYDAIGNYGIVVILFSVVLYALFIPSGLRQQRSMLRMQSLQDDVNEIKRLFPKDMAQQQQLTSELYKKHGVSQNPGCAVTILRLLIMFPTFAIFRSPMRYIGGVAVENIQKIANYLYDSGEIPKAIWNTVFSNDIPLISALQKSGSSLSKVVDEGWASLGQIINMNFFGIDLGMTPTWHPSLLFGSESSKYLPLLIFPILTLVTMFINMRLTAKSTLKPAKTREEKRRDKANPAKSAQQKDSTQSAMKSMNLFMPLIMLWTIFSFPAAMGVYWIVSNIIQIIQSTIGYYMYVLPFRKELAEQSSKFNRGHRN